VVHALYIGLAQMWNIKFGRTVLPLHPWESLEPTMARHGQRDPGQLHNLDADPLVATIRPGALAVIVAK
jgi:hypothetical protein